MISFLIVIFEFRRHVVHSTREKQNGV